MAEERVQRRLAAILAGDVAGYSRLMGVDKEDTLARLNAHRHELLEPTIAKHRGRMGIGGLIYRVNAVRLRINQVRLKAIDGPIDWIFHNALPVIGSISLFAGGAALIAGAAFAPLAIAGSTTFLLVSGIYRTWSETLILVASPDNS